MFQPVIKWSGSKRSQCEEIVEEFPRNIETYYEPFCGGASVMRKVMEAQDIKVKNYIISDINEDLINLWKCIQFNPSYLIFYYRTLWNGMNNKGKTEKEKREFFEKIRQGFNENHNNAYFLFLLRTCFNGMPRYNNKGEFNTSFHLNRPGIHPDKLCKIINEWSDLLNKNNVEFRCCSYKDIKPSSDNDFFYFDPPYANTNGMYFGGIDKNEFFNYLRDLKCGYVFSYDGKSGDEDNTVEVPFDIYDFSTYIKSGVSSFKRIKTDNKKAMVYESLYVKYKDNIVQYGT